MAVDPAAYSPVRPSDGWPPGVGAMVTDITAVQQAADRAARLYAITAALSRALTPAQVADVIVNQGRAALGASGGLVTLLADGGTMLEIVRAMGPLQVVQPTWARFPLSAPVPSAEAVRTGVPIWLDSLAVAATRYPRIAAAHAAAGSQAFAAIPLAVEGRTLGALGLSFATARRFAEADRAFMIALAQQCAQALERARLYAAARAAQAAAQAAVRLRDEFLSVAAHELRTPMTSLRGNVSLLLRRLDQPEVPCLEQLRTLAQRADRQTDKLARLVTRLLDVSRLESGKLRLEPEKTDLAELVQEVTAAAQATSSRHTIAVETPPRVEALVDPLRLEQVLANLLDNAIKYSPRGGSIGVELSQPDPATVRLAVRDHGIGIPPERRPRIFDRFYQAHGEGHLRGLGLGLYVSRQIVALHDGRIEAEFPEDGGTRFVIHLPRGLALATASR